MSYYLLEWKEELPSLDIAGREVGFVDAGGAEGFFADSDRTKRKEVRKRLRGKRVIKGSVQLKLLQ